MVVDYLSFCWTLNVLSFQLDFTLRTGTACTTCGGNLGYVFRGTGFPMCQECFDASSCWEFCNYFYIERFQEDRNAKATWMSKFLNPNNHASVEQTADDDFVLLKLLIIYKYSYGASQLFHQTVSLRLLSSSVPSNATLAMRHGYRCQRTWGSET